MYSFDNYSLLLEIFFVIVFRKFFELEMKYVANLMLTLNKGWNVEVWNLHQMFVFCFSCSRNILKQTLSEYRYLYFYGWSIILTSSGKRTKKFDRTQGLYSRKRYSSKSKWSAEHEWIHFCRLLLIPYWEE